jgi:hypothetical protein
MDTKTKKGRDVNQVILRGEDSLSEEGKGGGI